MEIIVAKTAGFCFGVKRAVDMAYEQAVEKNVYTFGPIIHNEHVVKDLENQGVRVINSEEEILNAPKGIVVVRAHGVTEDVYSAIEKAGHKLVDATCPFVLKIHNIVKKAASEGAYIVIIGDKNHPEVKGIQSSVLDVSSVLADREEVQEFMNLEENRHKKLCVVAQTTYNFKKFQEFLEIFTKNSYDKVDVLNTICNATEVRQKEAAEIAAQVDAMIVVGDPKSSNSQKLYEICKGVCEQTYFIQTAADMDFDKLRGLGRIGITAGASTPNNIIEEVQAQCQT